MTQAKFDLSLTAKDHDLYKSFMTLCRLDGKTRFSSDDFRMYGLDRFIRDTKHGIGALFARWKHAHLIREVDTKRSSLASNNMHLIRVYEFNERAFEVKTE